MAEGETGAKAKGATLALVIQSAVPERIHYALVLLAAAAALDRPAIGFFAGGGVRLLTQAGSAEFAEWDTQCAAHGIAGIATLLQSCRALGVRFIACELALVAHLVQHHELLPDLAVAGAVSLLRESEGGQLLFV